MRMKVPFLFQNLMVCKATHKNSTSNCKNKNKLDKERKATFKNAECISIDQIIKTEFIFPLDCRIPL